MANQLSALGRLSISSDVYGELKGAARRVLRRWPPQFSQPSATDLVNTTFLRMASQRSTCKSDAHLIGVASVLMSRATADLKRERGRLKRGGTWLRRPFTEQLIPASNDPTNQPRPRLDSDIWVEDLLRALESIHPREGTIARLRIGGASIEEMAEQLGCSIRTIAREWAHARAWLILQIRAEDD